MVSLKRKQSGFTLVELLIVIVVIGILAALVITSYAGVSQRARNSERQTDINAIATQLEVYYANNSSYPTAANLADQTWRTTYGFKIDTAAFQDPAVGAPANLVSSATETADPVASKDGYFYWTDGTRYRLSARYEALTGTAGTYVKKSND